MNTTASPSNSARQQFMVRYLQLPENAIQEATVGAVNEAQLRLEFAQQGRTVLRVVPTGSSRAWRLWRKRTPPAPNYPLFCREVRTLLRAGMTVVEAVETLGAREQLEGRAGSLSAQLLNQLQRGRSLSGALEQLEACPSVLIAAVRAGERTSNLVQALDDYLRFDSLVAHLRKKILSAAIYPALVSVVGLVISVFLLLVVMPNFAAMYDNLRGNGASHASLTITLTHWLGQHRSVVGGSLVVLAVALVLWVRSGRARAHFAALGAHWPWMCQRIQDFQLAMMYQALALLLKGGYPMTEALQVARQSALSDGLRQSLQEALYQVEQGGSVSQALASQDLCDEVGRRLMAAAERNGDFHLAADVVSRLHAERFELFVERVTRIAEPLLLLLVALVVGGIVVLMYMPVFDMATQLL